uniref:Uncharacterized protein n=1 Tax=Solanum lycopersicum TaxID=4081 RepID=A0A3Q7F7E2_SOLLC
MKLRTKRMKGSKNMGMEELEGLILSWLHHGQNTELGKAVNCYQGAQEGNELHTVFTFSANPPDKSASSSLIATFACPGTVLLPREAPGSEQSFGLLLGNSITLSTDAAALSFSSSSSSRFRINFLFVNTLD